MRDRQESSGPADERHRRQQGDRRVLKGPSAGGQHVCVSLGKLVKSQDLLIPWYLEGRDCDYLHVPRLAPVPVASAVSPT
jgi:hypothetical protein